MSITPEPLLLQNCIGETSPWPIWVIDHHYRDGCRTAVGELVYRAKYLNDETSSAELKEIIKSTVKILTSLKHSANLCRVNAVVAVPFFGAKQISLPHQIATVISQALDVEDLSNKVRKIKPTDAVKQEAKPVVDDSVFQADPVFQGQCILLVDDLYRSGATLESIAVNVRGSGALSLIGFCATKVLIGMARR